LTRNAEHTREFTHGLQGSAWLEGRLRNWLCRAVSIEGRVWRRWRRSGPGIDGMIQSSCIDVLGERMLVWLLPMERSRVEVIIVVSWSKLGAGELFILILG
jgi:hypothetical protein